MTQKIDQRGSAFLVVLLVIAAAIVVGGVVYGYLAVRDAKAPTTSGAAGSGSAGNTNAANTNTANVNSAANTNAAVSNTNATTNTNAAANTNTASNTNAVSTEGWKTYTNADYSYTLQYPKEYVTSGTQEDARFRKGQLAGDPTHTVSVRTFTDSNAVTFTEEEQEWYRWAKQDFPQESEGIFTARRSVKLGANTFTTFDFDPASGTGYKVVYFLRRGTVTYMLWDDRQGDRDVETNEQIISTLTFTN